MPQVQVQHITMKDKFYDLLVSCAKDALEVQVPRKSSRQKRDEKTSQVNRFVTLLFRKWFTSGGGSYFFLFNRNLFITNISFAELSALLKLHLNRLQEHEGGPVLIMSSDRLKDTIKLLWASIGEDGTSIGATRRKCQLITDVYFDLFSSVVLLNSFFGSAVVHVPPTLTIDLAKICGESGYIHSCGTAIYVRKTSKSSEAAFFGNLGRYLAPFRTRHERVFFVPYAHESFSEYDKSDEAELRHGLNDVKVYLDKFYFGHQPLSDVIRRMQTHRTLKDVLYVAPGVIPYRREREEFKDKPNSNTDVTIWLLIEKSIRRGSKYPGDDRYYVCYAQAYRNKNPFIFFNEKKPGWVAPVTLPHTLSAAMLNISRPYIHARGRSGESAERVICMVDPFAGTGTTYLEALKLGKEQSFVANDVSAISRQIILDNLWFFSLSAEKLGRLVEVVSTCQELLKGKISFPRQRAPLPPIPEGWENPVSLFRWGAAIVSREVTPYLKRGTGSLEGLRELHSHNFSAEVLSAFTDELKHFGARLMFYLIWRAILRNIYRIGVRFEGIEAAISAEFKEFYSDALKLIEIRASKRLKTISDDLEIQDGCYSPECVIPAMRIEEHWKQVRNHKASKAIEALSRNSTDRIITGDAICDCLALMQGEVDVIITDPPYGFNTDYEDVELMARLYGSAIPAMVRALREHGQILFCLPERSHNGQPVPYFATKEMITGQLIAAAEIMGKEVILNGSIRPSPEEMFTPPYYWQSERALTRTILHFRIQNA